MTVQLIKTNKTTKAVGAKNAKPVAVKSEVDLRAEKLIQLYPAVKAAQVVTKAYDEDRKFLAAQADEIGQADQEVVFSVDGGTVKFTAKASQTRITDPAALHKKLGDDAFYKLVKFSVEDLKKYLSASEIEEVSTSELSGARRISVTLKDA